MILAVTYLAVVMPGIAEVEIFWVAGVSMVVFAFATGWMFGAWYQPVNGEKPTFELFFLPSARPRAVFDGQHVRLLGMGLDAQFGVKQAHGSV